MVHQDTEKEYKHFKIEYHEQPVDYSERLFDIAFSSNIDDLKASIIQLWRVQKTETDGKKVDYLCCKYNFLLPMGPPVDGQQFYERYPVNVGVRETIFAIPKYNRFRQIESSTLQKRLNKYLIPFTPEALEQIRHPKYNVKNEEGEIIETRELPLIEEFDEDVKTRYYAGYASTVRGEFAVAPNSKHSPIRIVQVYNVKNWEKLTVSEIMDLDAKKLLTEDEYFPDEDITKFGKELKIKAK